jgi:LPXTG-motif cell wall-anchored protein
MGDRDGKGPVGGRRGRVVTGLRAIPVAAVTGAVLLFAGSGGDARAQAPPEDPYGNGTVTTTTNPGTPEDPGNPDETELSGSITLAALPVTGGDVVGIVVLGLGTAALGSGLVLSGRRRRNRGLHD